MQHLRRCCNMVAWKIFDRPRGDIDQGQNVTTDVLQQTKSVSYNFPSTCQLLLKCYATDDHIARVNIEIRTFKWGPSTATSYAQQLWTSTLRCELVYNETNLKDLFIEGVGWDFASLCARVGTSIPTPRLKTLPRSLSCSLAWKETRTRSGTRYLSTEGTQSPGRHTTDATNEAAAAWTSKNGHHHRRTVVGTSRFTATSRHHLDESRTTECPSWPPNLLPRWDPKKSVLTILPPGILSPTA